MVSYSEPNQFSVHPKLPTVPWCALIHSYSPSELWSAYLIDWRLFFQPIWQWVRHHKFCQNSFHLSHRSYPPTLTVKTVSILRSLVSVIFWLCSMHNGATMEYVHGLGFRDLWILERPHFHLPMFGRWEIWSQLLFGALYQNVLSWSLIDGSIRLRCGT